MKSSRDDSSKSSSSSKSSKASIAKLKKDFKKSKKAFATLQTQIEDIDNESVLSSSDIEETTTSNLQFSGKDWNGTRNEQMFLSKKIKRASTAKLNLCNIILLDNESTMDLFCNKSIVNKITKSKSRLKVQSNGGSMYVTRDTRVRKKGMV